jgi:hypothetical protein
MATTKEQAEPRIIGRPRTGPTVEKLSATIPITIMEELRVLTHAKGTGISKFVSAAILEKIAREKADS